MAYDDIYDALVEAAGTIRPNRDKMMLLLGEYPAIENDFAYFVAKLGEGRFTDLLELIKKSNFKEYKDDFLYLAYRFHLMDYCLAVSRSANELARCRDLEIINAAKLIGNSKDSDVQIIIKNKTFTDSATISNYLVVGRFAKFILEQYKKLGKAPKAQAKPKGRKKRHDNLGYYAFILQGYLQNNTYLKAKEGISISNQQAGFIYSFLDILGIAYIPEGSYEIDYIRKYFNKYRRGKAPNVRQEKRP